jgi:hypothetical protein
VDGPVSFFLMPLLAFALFFVGGLVFFVSVFASGSSKWRWLSMGAVVVGIGGIILWNMHLRGPRETYKPTCDEMTFAPNYKLVILTYPWGYSEGILLPTNGLLTVTPNLDALTRVGEYVLGHSAEASPRYFWFNLRTRALKRYSDEQSARSAEVVQKLGLTEVPELRDIDTFCREVRCRPCSSDVNIDKLSTR